MEKQLKSLLKSLKINENLISTIMGGLVVVVMAAMIFNYFKTFNKSGQISDQAAVNLSEEEVLAKELPTTYKVVKGDDLWHISERFYNSGYNYVDIAKASKLANASAIEVGQELVIPKVVAKKATVIKAETAKRRGERGRKGKKKKKGKKKESNRKKGKKKKKDRHQAPNGADFNRGSE